MNEARDPHDSYETPKDAVHQLLGSQRLEGRIWDPSCGRGMIVQALIDASIDKGRIFASDKYVHRARLDDPPVSGMISHGIDFLEQASCPDIANIVMNPPFSQSDAHVRHALQIIPSNGMVCVLLRLTWMSAKKRADFLMHLTKIIMVGRLKMLPEGAPDKGHGGTVDFAWFIFEPRMIESTIIVRAK
jgi:hypothetical protein